MIRKIFLFKEFQSFTFTLGRFGEKFWKLDALEKNSENSLENGEIEGQDKLKDQVEKRIMIHVQSTNINAVKDTNSTTTGTFLLE